MASSIPIDIIPQIVSYLPESCLHEVALIPPFLIPAQQLLFREIELSSLFHCSSLASLLRDTQSSHLASYVRRLQISLRETAAVIATGGKSWFDDAQELLSELLGKLVFLEEFDMNYWASRSYGSLRWQSRLTQNLQDAITRTLSLPSLTVFRLQRVNFSDGFTLDGLLSNFVGKRMKRIALENVVLWNPDGGNSITFSELSSGSTQPYVEAETFHLNLDFGIPAQLLLWLLHPQCPIKYSTIQQLCLTKFVGHNDKVTELISKATALNVLELILYGESFNFPLTLKLPPTLKALLIHFPHEYQQICDPIQWLESSISTLNLDNNIEKITITFIVGTDSALTDTTVYHIIKPLWRHMGYFMTRPDRFSKLKKVDFVLYWIASREMADEHARTLEGCLRENGDREGGPTIGLTLSYDRPEAWVQYCLSPRR